jgi:hypothetical protein
MWLIFMGIFLKNKKTLVKAIKYITFAAQFLKKIQDITFGV